MSRFIITDDHPLFRSALAQAVGKIWPDGEVIEAETIASARQALDDGPCDMLLLDLHLPDSEGLAPLLDFRQDFPAMPVAVVSASEEDRVIRAAQSLGASAFIPKSASLDDMCRALSAVRDGDIWFHPSCAAEGEDESDDFSRLASLTPAQRKILLLMNEGLLNKQIAFQMEITEATVKAHITAIFRKLGVINRTQAVLIAQKLDVAEPATQLP
ncbi:two component transcriptional regulator, LuxR family [Parasphingorhabdus marina DSM 22363]|uniref:Two component transcriptional regulator, LuxR family n=1 Tax=Parasphingorhabdus marina DSM 22363 TaxID=1123272 RepID=A0A1N6CM99_9SPHN|nr:response regulator transcription factor [Parasphingorhabdus marina]SIN59691.1 two component transcriptional regulator, LuxR family [Parasphingorhabdus marina DSM 22363]